LDGIFPIDISQSLYANVKGTGNGEWGIEGERGETRRNLKY
jgi:hypothetical protein